MLYFFKPKSVILEKKCVEGDDLEVIETRIPFIDFSLGKLSGGQVLLFTADSSTLNDVLMFSILVTFSLLERGMSCVTVQTDLPFSLATRKFEHAFLPEKFPLLMSKLDDGHLIYLDLASGRGQPDDGIKNLTGVRLVGDDIDRLLYEAVRAMDDVKKRYPESRVVFLYHNISSSIVDYGSKAVLNMLRKLIANIRKNGDIFIGVVNRDIHEPEITNTLKHISSYAVEFGLEMKGDSPHPYLQVSKTPIVGVVKRILHKKIAYHISGNKFETFSPISFYLDELEDGQVFYQKGEVSILSTKHLVLPVQFMVNLLKALEKNLDYEEYRKYFLEVGKEFGARNVRVVESEFKLKEDRLLFSTLRYVGARGYGKLLGIDGGLKTGRVKIRIHSAIAEMWGESDRPVDVLIESGLRGILEEITGKEWTCEETKCIAKGDDYCEFELTALE